MVRLNPVLLALGVLCALQVPEVSADNNPLNKLLDELDVTKNSDKDAPSKLARDFKKTRDVYEVMFHKWNLKLSFEIEDIVFQKFDQEFIEYFGITSMSELQVRRDNCDARHQFGLSNFVIPLEAKALALTCVKRAIKKAEEIQGKFEELNDKIEKMYHDVSPCFYLPESSRSRRSPGKTPTLKKHIKSGLMDWGKDKISGLVQDGLHSLANIRLQDVMGLWKQACISDDVAKEAKDLRDEILKLIRQFKNLRKTDWTGEPNCLNKDSLFEGQNKVRFNELYRNCKSRRN